VKKAVVERLRSVYRVSWFEEIGVHYQIEFFIFKDIATLMIDTSGAPLHKRGYRTEANGAPLRETLAAALASIARPREDVLFWDPMCGSGTIAIEAALQMANIAPGLHRPFAAEKFPQIKPSAWREARAEAQAKIRTDSAFEAYASDIDPVAVELTKENCRRAGVTKWVKAFQRDARQIKTGGRRGTVVCNPPYGERLMTMQEAESLYRDMGKHFATLDSWQIYVLTSHEGFERLYGRRADKVRKLYNGMIPCSYYQFFKPKDDRQIVRSRSCNYQGERRGGDKPPFEKKNRHTK
jgi:putative N6-adenine-specific DNA methylase